MNYSFDQLLFNPGDTSAENSLITTKEAQQDIDVLIYALKNAYPAIWAMESDEWLRVLNQLSTLRLPRDLTRKSLGILLADILWAIPDGHLKVRLGSETLGEKYHRNLRKPSTGMNISNGKVWVSQILDAPSGKVPVIGISWFPQSCESTWDGFLEEIEKITSFNTVVFDLRGNGGGDDSKAIEATSVLLGKSMGFEWIRVIICESSESYALQANTYSKILWQNYGSKNLTPPVELENQLASLKNQAAELKGTKPRKEIINGTDSNIEMAASTFEGKIFVLIDSATVSSGEWTALYLKQHPNTILVGENTYGMIHFGNSGLLRLPNSKLDISLCMKINELIDGRFFEKKGITPDIVVQNQDSLEYILSKMI